MTDHNCAFITSHAAILIEVARNRDATVRELATRADLTERQAHRVLGDLVEADYVVRTRVGRRNTYSINVDRPMRHRAVAHHRVGQLLEALAPDQRVVDV